MMASTNLAQTDSTDRQPAFPTTLAVVPADDHAGSAAFASAIPKARPQHVVLYQEHPVSARALREALARRRFDVRNAVMLNDIGGWLLVSGYSAVVVVEVPSIDTFRKAVLKEVRRLAKEVPVIVLAKVVTPDVERDAEAARVVCVLPTDADPEEIVTAVEVACEDGESKSVSAENEPNDWEDA